MYDVCVLAGLLWPTRIWCQDIHFAQAKWSNVIGRSYCREKCNCAGSAQTTSSKAIIRIRAQGKWEWISLSWIQPDSYLMHCLNSDRFIKLAAQIVPLFASETHHLLNNNCGSILSKRQFSSHVFTDSRPRWRIVAHIPLKFPSEQVLMGVPCKQRRLFSFLAIQLEYIKSSPFGQEKKQGGGGSPWEKNTPGANKT